MFELSAVKMYNYINVVVCEIYNYEHSCVLLKYYGTFSTNTVRVVIFLWSCLILCVIVYSIYVNFPSNCLTLKSMS